MESKRLADMKFRLRRINIDRCRFPEKDPKKNKAEALTEEILMGN